TPTPVAEARRPPAGVSHDRGPETPARDGGGRSDHDSRVIWRCRTVAERVAVTVIRSRFPKAFANSQKGRCDVAKRRSDEEEGVQGGGDVGSEGGAGANTSDKPRPVHEERIGRVKATVWANQTANGVRHNVTLRRIFKRDASATWEQSDSFG